MKTKDIKDRETINAFLESVTDRDQARKNGFIPMNLWGKDHWSLVGYIFTRATDYNSILDYNHLRAKSAVPGKIHARTWQPSWGTRLRGFWTKDTDGKSIQNPSMQLADHDDFDCLSDMEAEGLITRGTIVSRYASFTPQGLKIATKLMAFKASGGNFGNFSVD